MVPVLKELLNQTAVSVTQLEIQLMPFTRTKMTSVYVSTVTFLIHNHVPQLNYNNNSVAFCKLNCAVIGSSGCTTCKDGFMREPECCRCESGRTEVNGVCSKY